MWRCSQTKFVNNVFKCDENTHISSLCPCIYCVPVCVCVPSDIFWMYTKIVSNIWHFIFDDESSSYWWFNSNWRHFSILNTITAYVRLSIVCVCGFCHLWIWKWWRWIHLISITFLEYIFSECGIVFQRVCVPFNIIYIYIYKIQERLVLLSPFPH